MPKIFESLAAKRKYSREYMRAYRERLGPEYRAKLNAQAKATREAHPEREKAKRRKYRQKHLTRIQARERAWRAANKAIIKAQWTRSMLAHRATKERAVAHMGGKCVDCQLAYPAPVYDFHHVGKKRALVTALIGSNHSWKRILEELKECVLLCSNCHRLRHCGKPRK